MNKTPAVRFKGFTEDWEQRKLSEMTAYRNGRGHEDKQSNSGKYELINLNSVSIDGGLKPSGKFIDESNDTLCVDDLVMVLSDVGHGDLLGRVAIIPENNGFVLNQRVALLRPNDSVYSRFLLVCINAHQSYFKLNGAGSSQLNISKDVVEDFAPHTPEITEQKLIAHYFSNIDYLITLHQRKYEKLVNIKKSMLYKMFPQNGSKVPEIRFAGFTGDWEQRKLKDIASSFEYGLNAAAKEFDEVNKYLRITDIDDASRAFRDDDVTSPDANLSLADNYRLQKGDVLFARTGASVGKSYIYRKSDGLVYFAGFLIRARIKPEYSEEFIFQNTLTTQYEKYIQFTSQRSGQPGVNAQEYGEYSLLMPDYQEQKIIGNILHQIDNLIILHHRKLEKLKQLKQAMLHKMFV